MTTVRRVSGGATAGGAKAAEGLSASDQAAIMKMVATEKKAAGLTPHGMRSAGTRGGHLVCKYLAPSPNIVPGDKPWDNMDAHVALINQVTKDGKMSRKEAALIRKLFNHDIAAAKKDGKDIRKDVANYLHKVLDGVKAERTVRNLVFGPGGPGFKPQIMAIIAPPRPPGPLAILPPTRPPGPLAILPPTRPPGPLAILPPVRPRGPISILPPTRGGPFYILPPNRRGGNG